MRDDLFDCIEPTDPVARLHRAGDPETSAEAAASIIAGVTELEQRVCGIIETFGTAGCISDQVRNHPSAAGLSYSSVTARFKLLYEKGQISYTGEKRMGNSGRFQRVMVGCEYLRRDWGEQNREAGA